MGTNVDDESSKKLNYNLDFLDDRDSSHDDSLSEESTQQEEKIAKKAVFPWLRYWARFIDITSFSLIFGIFCVFAMPSLLQTSIYVLSIIIIFIWIFVEAILLSSVGTTFGKWLLKIDLKSPTGKPQFSTALNRCFSVWLKGYGMGIPFVVFFTNLASYSYLTREGITSWDLEGNFVVTHRKIGIIRGTTAFVIIVAFLSILRYTK